MKASRPPNCDALTMADSTLALVPHALRLCARAVAATAGETICHSGARPRAIFFVLSGDVRLVRRSSAGAEIVLQRSHAGFIAEASLQSARYHCDIVSAGDSRLLAFPVREFKSTLRSDVAFNETARAKEGDHGDLRSDGE